MDALKGIGHACGHNLIGISGGHLCTLPTFNIYICINAGVAVACAIKHVLEQHNISGNVVLLGTPGMKISPLLNALTDCCVISRGRFFWKGSSPGKGRL